MRNSSTVIPRIVNKLQEKLDTKFEIKGDTINVIANKDTKKTHDAYERASGINKVFEGYAKNYRVKR